MNQETTTVHPDSLTLSGTEAQVIGAILRREISPAFHDPERGNMSFLLECNDEGETLVAAFNWYGCHRLVQTDLRDYGMMQSQQVGTYSEQTLDTLCAAWIKWRVKQVQLLQQVCKSADTPGSEKPEVTEDRLF